jgi:uncharacterized membrane protein (UPF0127 family)
MNIENQEIFYLFIFNKQLKKQETIFFYIKKYSCENIHIVLIFLENLLSIVFFLELKLTSIHKTHPHKNLNTSIHKNQAYP